MNVDNRERGVGPIQGWREHLGWALLHDIVCHPLMAAFGYPHWAVRFHNWTGRRAWRPTHQQGPML